MSAEAGKLDTVMSDTRLQVLRDGHYVDIPGVKGVSWEEPDDEGEVYIPIRRTPWWSGDLIEGAPVRDEYNHPLTVGEMRERKRASEAARRLKGRQPDQGYRWLGTRTHAMYLDEVARFDPPPFIANNPGWHAFAKAARAVKMQRQMADYRRRQLAASVPRRNYVADYHERRNNRVNVDGFNVHRWLAEALDLPWTELPLDIPERTATPW